MTNTRKTLKGLLAVLLSFCMTAVLWVCAFAATETVTETVAVTQLIKTFDEKTKKEYEFPQRTEYTYVLTPKRPENPMPEGTKDGLYTISIWGEAKDENAHTFQLEIDKTKPGVYEYVLAAKEEVPAGDSLSPTSHIFGYKVEVDEKTGELVVVPYICQSGQPIFSDPDESGYPTKLTLPNEICGKEKVPTTTTPQKTVSTTVINHQTRTVTTTKTNIITRVTRAVNTGDESHLILWITILAVAAIGLILILFARRKKDDEENQ